MSEPREGVYQVLEIKLGKTYTEHPIIIGGNILVVGQIPITVMARINDKKGKQVNLSIFRNIKMKIDRIYITTTATSATDLILFTSKDVEVEALGFGARAQLVDTLGIEYDARDIADELADSTIAVIVNTETYTGAQFATEGFNKIIGMLFADRNLTLYIEQSWNGVNYDEITTVAYVANSVDGGFSVEIIGLYARIRVNNASGADTTITRLGAYLSSGA